MDKPRFLALWGRCKTDTGVDDGDLVYDCLFDYYSEASRHYHTPLHSEHCLRQFDAARAEMVDPDAIELALWFHDVIYETDVDSGENERASAELFSQCAGTQFETSFRDQVYRLIMVTTHSESPQTLDEAFMVDIDLSSFGLPWAAFSSDSEHVRAEFPQHPDDVFYTKQRVFMESLLNRDNFCFTEFFRARHEAQAKENISRHLEMIRQRIPA